MREKQYLRVANDQHEIDEEHEEQAPDDIHPTLEQQRRRRLLLLICIFVSILVLATAATAELTNWPKAVRSASPPVPLPLSMLLNLTASNTFSPTAPQRAPPNTRALPNTTCEWELLPPASTCSSDSEQVAVSLCSDLLRDASNASTVPIWRCVHGTTRTLLVGPFRSRVQEWHSIAFSAPLLRRGDRIVRFTGDAIRADDATTTIGYPPLHVHHLHVHHWPYQSHWFETHGDYLNGAGVPADYSLSSPPAGTCVVQDDDRPITVDAQLNDVRFSSGTAMAGDSGEIMSASRLAALRATAPPFSWYLRIAFELDDDLEAAANTRSSRTPAAHAAPKPPCTPVHKLILGFPMDAHAISDPLARFDAGRQETLFSWTLTLPYAGRLVPPAWFHLHRARQGGYLLLKGEHILTTLLGMQTTHRAAVGALRASLPHGNRTATLRQRILERTARDGSLLCHDDAATPSSIAFRERGDGNGGIFDRQGAIVCSPFRFDAGDVVTVVYLSRPVWAAELSPFAQHANLFFYYTADAEGPTPQLVDVLLADTTKGYTVIDLDGDLEGARSVVCEQRGSPAFGVWAQPKCQNPRAPSE